MRKKILKIFMCVGFFCLSGNQALAGMCPEATPLFLGGKWQMDDYLVPGEVKELHRLSEFDDSMPSWNKMIGSRMKDLCKTEKSSLCTELKKIKKDC